MHIKTFEVPFGGKMLTAEFSDLTEQTNGSVMMRYGETVVLITAVMSARPSGAPYFPLSVEFEERFYAAGAILGSRFVRREGKPSDEAVLSARIIDRTIRPLFNHDIRNEVQVIATVLAMGEDDPDVIAVVGASLALAVSDIPWDGPIGAVRIARRKATGELIVNPSYVDREVGNLSFEVLSCGKDNTINMIETAGEEIAEDDIVAVLEASTKIHATLEEFQKRIAAEIGKEKRELSLPAVSPEVAAYFKEAYRSRLQETLFSGRAGKDHIHQLKEAFVADAAEHFADVSGTLCEEYFEKQVDAVLHEGVIKEKRRADGRAFDEIRPLYAQAGGISPVLHGSGIFYRGATHVLTALTLGGPEAAQLIDSIEETDTKKRYMHHYNFPPFSVGEAGRVGGFNRRMVGHGALAEKALLPVLPPQEQFPYTIRLVSETLSSNGSSSMASVCGSSLALMDGGVPIVRPVAGIASGLMMDGGEYVLLTDIQGPEDEHGDMDFKVAGTSEGVTAIQMDVKVGGVPVAVLAEALQKAKEARLQILAVMAEAIASPREAISPRAPKIVTMKVLPEQIGLVIGGGGKTINGIKDDTGVEEISIEDDGTVYITGKGDAPEKAAARIAALTKVYALGDTVDATITRVTDFGAFARIDDLNEGLIHISEIAPFRLANLNGVLKEGDVVHAVVTKTDNGKIGLSIKKIDPDFAARRGIVPPKETL
jgi:polyribonucleotide nucleotidyltransferase